MTSPNSIMKCQLKIECLILLLYTTDTLSSNLTLLSALTQSVLLKALYK